jgi:hypothetical protein
LSGTAIGAGGEVLSTELFGFDGVSSSGINGEAVIGWDLRRNSFVIGPRIVAGFGNVSSEVWWD